MLHPINFSIETRTFHIMLLKPICWRYYVHFFTLTAHGTWQLNYCCRWLHDRGSSFLLRFLWCGLGLRWFRAVAVRQ